MNRRITRLAAAMAALALSASLAFAAPPQDKGKKPGPTCPVCHMTLSAKKTAKMNHAVKVGKKTYYCCGCDMSQYKDKKGHIVLPAK